MRRAVAAILIDPPVWIGAPRLHTRDQRSESQRHLADNPVADNPVADKPAIRDADRADPSYAEREWSPQGLAFRHRRRGTR